VQKRLCN